MNCPKWTLGYTISTSDTFRLVNFSLHPLVLITFSKRRSTSHRQVFNCSPKSCKSMPFDMSKNNHSLCIKNIPGYPNGLEMLSRDIHIPITISRKPICYQDRSINNCIRKSMSDGGCYMICCIVSRSNIHCISISQKWFSRQFFDSIDNLSDKNRFDIRIIAKLSKVQLNGC